MAAKPADLRFRLRAANIGGIVVQNIICVVVDGDGGALLGQAVLSKLRSWKIDNERQTLDIGQAPGSVGRAIKGG